MRRFAMIVCSGAGGWLGSQIAVGRVSPFWALAVWVLGYAAGSLAVWPTARQGGADA